MKRSTVVARFDGITIRMYPLNHHPSHFHAEYAGSAAVYAIPSCEVLAGGLPASQHRKVVEWAEARTTGLESNWEQIRKGEFPEQIG